MSDYLHFITVYNFMCQGVMLCLLMKSNGKHEKTDFPQ